MTIKQTLPLLILAATLALPASAQVQKIGTVDLRKTFGNYWKAKEADSSLKEETAGMEKTHKTMTDQIQKEQEIYKKLLDSASDATVSAEERRKRNKSAAETLTKLKELQNNVEQFDRQARTKLGEKQRRMRDNLLDEVRSVIKAKAKAGSYTLIVNASAESINSTPIVLYSTGENDLTDEVVKDLNANAPLQSKTSEPKPSATAEKEGKN